MKPALSLTRKRYLAYLSICLIWGSTWDAIRLLVRDVPPLRAAAIRFLLSAVILFVIVFATGHATLLSRKHWRALIILGFTMMALPYGLLFWAEYRIPSSLTVVLFSTCPLFVALFTPLLTRAGVPRRAVFAMLIALGGIAVLLYGPVSFSAYTLAGALAVLLAVIMSGWSAVFAKREITGVNPLLATAIQFSVSAVVLFAGSLALERDRPSAWNATSVLALAFLTIFGSLIAFSLYYWLLRTMHAYQLSTTNLVIPVIAMAEGALILREPVPWTMVMAAVLVLVSVGMVLRADEEDVTRLRLEE